MTRLLLALSLAAPLLAGCAVGPDYVTPDFGVPNSWSSDRGRPAPALKLAQWWHNLADPQLDQLITEAVGGNLDVASAKARIREARATQRQAIGALFPSISGTGSATETRSASSSTGGVAIGPTTYSQYQAGFDSSWELDLFGANRRAAEAASYGVDAADDDLRATLLTLIGDVASNYIDARAYQARVARYRERRTRHLYEMSKALAVGRSQQDIATTSERFIASTFQARSQLLLPDAQGKLLPLTHQPGLTPWDDAIARWSFDKGQPAGAGTDTLPGVPYQILPLKSAARTWGLLVVEPENLRQLMIPEQQRLLETFTLLVASALERLTLTASEEQARLTSERESLRNSLLAALSHDLRTPLTVLFGQAEILTLDLASEGSKHAPQAN
ncbi:MAG: TolC family protein, partial [Bradyrhizobium sp.]|nr:TolC family protein [Bradyrhizobium sp.]